MPPEHPTDRSQAQQAHSSTPTSPLVAPAEASSIAEFSQQSPARQSLRTTSSFRAHDLSRGDGSESLTAAEGRLRRPASARRASTTRLPRRGQDFSVEDASQEVDQDAAQQRQASRASGSTRRQHSTVRRRAIPNAQRLASIEATEGEEDGEPSRSFFEPGSLNRVPTLKDNLPKSQLEDDENGTDTVGNSPPGGDEDEEDEDDEDVSDAESFTLKDRQQAINETHPFGIRLWKPALYKKGRSVEKDAEGDIHSAPGGQVSKWLYFFNFLWTLLFGWWLALLASLGAGLCFVLGFAPGCVQYGRIFWGLARYLFYPFGKYVKLIQEDAYAQEDEGEGRSISEYERWQQGDLEEGRLFFGPVRTLIGRRRSQDDSEDESTALLGRQGRQNQPDGETSARKKLKKRLFGRGSWNLGRVVFFAFFYGLVTPALLFVSGICWLLVFSIPMGRMTLLLLQHLIRRPLALEFHSDTTGIRDAGSTPSAIILCTYRAVGSKYWKYTIDGTNIFLINLLAVVAFTIFDYFVLYEALGLEIFITNNILVFLLALFSIIPLAYFIGQAVASISAQSTMGVGAVINAFFSTIVEVFLYCVALNEGKAQLVEGSIIGSIFAGILFLPGLSMCFGALKRKTQRFNVRSAGVTSTMLLFAMIGAFGPTLFYEIYGSHRIECHACLDEETRKSDSDCQRCYFSQFPDLDSSFYQKAVRPFCYFAAGLLFLAYVIGLLFTLRTHAATIWNSELEEKKTDKATSMPTRQMSTTAEMAKVQTTDYGAVGSSSAVATGGQSQGAARPPSISAAASSKTDIKESQLFKRVFAQSLKQVSGNAGDFANDDSATVRSPTSLESSSHRSNSVPGLSAEDNKLLIRQIAEIAATAATVAAKDATQNPRRAHALTRTSTHGDPTGGTGTQTPGGVMHQSMTEEHGGQNEPAGGHDAPNWGRVKSCTVLLTATLAYAVIAEILVDTVDAVLSSVDIDQKFLGITLFALVPNTTEFLNAISFAMNGNIALSMEIGSAYALQVALLQIPALVLYSAVHGRYIDPADIIDHTFTLLFPQWDMVTVILCVFLLSYVYGEGKSNYFKGSVLILSYFVVVAGFYLTRFVESSTGGSNGGQSSGSGLVAGQFQQQQRFRSMNTGKPIIIVGG